MNDRVFVIAEVGVNHNGSIELAKKLVDAAVEAGADAVKFQAFVAEKLLCRTAPKAEYQKQNTASEKNQYGMLKELELNPDEYVALKRYCDQNGIVFMSSPFDIDSAVFLDGLGMEIFKIPSGEIANLPYLRKIGALGKRVIVSTGMSDLREVKSALDILCSSGTKRGNITILQCNTSYPTPVEDVNLRAIPMMRRSLGVDIGYSDHTIGIEVPIAAVALGSTVIEKHITLDKNMEGPDHKASLEPHELKAMVAAIRNIEKALGDGIKRLSASEMENKLIARKSLVAARKIMKGERFSPDNIAIKRPGTGISPMRYDWILECAARMNIEADMIITLEHIEEV